MCDMKVSSKYLELTKKKLELTRLPHEVALEKDREWELGTPKSVVEPLIDYWYVILFSVHSSEGHTDHAQAGAVHMAHTRRNTE